MLIGQHICLAPLMQEDAALLFTWQNSLELMHLDGLYRPVSQSDFERWWAGTVNNPHCTVFAIRIRADMRLIGYVQISGIHPVFHSAEIGILIGEEQDRGRGYGTQALRLCVPYCWQELNLQRLYLLLAGDNPRARKAYDQAGFMVEGVLRRALYRNGQYADGTIMALLRDAS